MLTQIPFLGDALQIILALHSLALIIVNLTDTPKDNEMVAKVYRWVEFLAGIVKPSKVKQPNPVEKGGPISFNDVMKG